MSIMIFLPQTSYFSPKIVKYCKMGTAAHTFHKLADQKLKKCMREEILGQRQGAKVHVGFCVVKISSVNVVV